MVIRKAMPNFFQNGTELRDSVDIDEKVNLSEADVRMLASIIG